ncbi:hypothetical protein niasHT_019702 [Heterodera trifolii]|uniref:Secreted protein n=1 Tax=Heterodera trifolii TaxID=157864 RepID=A0ABD2LC27_9BILA
MPDNVHRPPLALSLCPLFLPSLFAPPRQCLLERAKPNGRRRLPTDPRGGVAAKFKHKGNSLPFEHTSIKTTSLPLPIFSVRSLKTQTNEQLGGGKRMITHQK